MNEQQHVLAERIARECIANDIPLSVAVERAFQAGLNHRSIGKARMSLTRQQRNLLAYIEEYTTRHDGIAPSYDEMCKAIGVRSKSGINRIMVALEERGRIARLPNHARAIEILAAA